MVKHQCRLNFKADEKRAPNLEINCVQNTDPVNDPVCVLGNLCVEAGIAAAALARADQPNQLVAAILFTHQWTSGILLKFKCMMKTYKLSEIQISWIFILLSCKANAL